MWREKPLLIAISFVVVCLLFHAQAWQILSQEQKKVNINTQIALEEVERSFDLTTPALTREKTSLRILNDGASSVSTLHLAIPSASAKQLSLIRVTLPGNEILDITSSAFENKLNKEAVFFEVKLSKELSSKATLSLTVEAVYVNTAVPYPKSIKQKENQKVLYVGNAYFYSPYSVKTQKTTYKLGTSIVESFTEVRPSDRRGDTVVYGSYYNQKAFSAKEIKIHFQNNNAFAIATSLERIIEVSHWGNLAIEEHYEIRHAGAKLKGTFSRLEYQRNPYQSSPSSFRVMKAHLPLEAQDIYYRDRIGNISTSDCRPSGNKLEVDFLPRFPMFGGWKTKFYMGYNLPLSKFMQKSGNEHTLKVSFGSPFGFLPVEEITVKVIIPEGASNVQVSLPFDVDSQTREVMKTYLDTVGRTVVVLRKENVAPEHSQEFKVSYSFGPLALLQEPLLVIGALFTFCVSVMVYVRLNLTIKKTESELKKENQTSIIELFEVFVEKQSQRDALYQLIIGRFNSLVRSNSIDREVKDIKKQREKIKESIKQICSGLNALDAKDYASKIGSVEKFEEEKFEILEKIVNLRKEGSSDAIKKKISAEEVRFDAKTREINDVIASGLVD